MKKRACLAVLATSALGILFLAGCGGPAPAGAGITSIEAIAPEVQVAQPVRKALDHVTEQPGRIEAFEQTPLFARIAGYVKEVRIEIGTKVKKGDVLAELEVPEMVEELKLKQGLVRQAELEIGQAEQTVRVVSASVQTAVSLVTEAEAGRKKARSNVQRWQSECARMEQLVKTRVVDTQTADETRNQCRAAEAAAEEAEARVQSATAAKAETEAKRDKADADLAAARNRLVLAETEVRRLQALLGYSRIVAPFDGVVTDRHVHTGHYLQAASGGTSKGEPLFVVVRMDKVRVFVDVPEADAVLVQEGSPGCIRVQVLNDREFTGTVAATSWSLEPGQRTLRTEIDLPNPDGILRPGMYVHASIRLERPGAWTLPSSAILVRDGVTFCYRVENSKAVRTPLRIGARDGATVEVLKRQRRPDKPGERPRWEDPSGDEQVIVTRPSELNDGQTVQVGPGGS